MPNPNASPALNTDTSTIDPGSIFDDIAPDASATPVTNAMTNPMQTPASTQAPAHTPAAESESAPALTIATPSDTAAAPTTTETSTSQPGTAQPEEVEVEESELVYLRDVAKGEPDKLIAKMLSYRKGNSTLQSRIDKVKAILGADFIAAAERGEVPDLTGRLVADLADEAFQSHVADFYGSHELRDGRYVRTKSTAPAPDLLKEYSTLVLEKASLNVGAFMPDDEEFDATEAMTNRASASGKALAQFTTREREIDQRLDAIVSASTSSSAPNAAITPESAANAKAQAISRLTAAHAELRDPAHFDRFRTYVAEHQSDPLEIYFQAFSATQQKNARVQRLVVTELETIARNQQAAAAGTPGKAAGDGKPIPGNIDPTQAQQILADADYFGDTL